MIKFLLLAILFALCWPIALVIGVIWCCVMWVSAIVGFISWLIRPR